MSEQPLAFRQIERKAIKSHKCCECGREIHKGDKYKYSSGISSEKDAFSYKQCLICSKAFNAASDISDFDDMPCFTGLREWMGNYFSRNYPTQKSVDSICMDLGLTEYEVRYIIPAKWLIL